MADQAVVHLGENSPEHVALQLFHEVAWAEKKELYRGAGGPDRPDRAYILDTYAECLRAVKNPHSRAPKRQGA